MHAGSQQLVACRQWANQQVIDSGEALARERKLSRAAWDHLLQLAKLRQEILEALDKTILDPGDIHQACDQIADSMLRLMDSLRENNHDIADSLEQRSRDTRIFMRMTEQAIALLDAGSTCNSNQSSN